MKNQIFSVDNPKAAKSVNFGYLNAIHYMAPHMLAGVGNLCPHASSECVKWCLGEHSGAAIYYPKVIQSRIQKAKRFMNDRQGYLGDVVKAIKSVERKASKLGLTPCIRLNGSTDVAFENVKISSTGVSIVDMFRSLQFVDYTKNKSRALAHATGKLPANYHLTFSRSETNDNDCLEVLKAGGQVAVVFRHALPAFWQGFPVVNGDWHDLLHLHPRGHVIGLSPKGKLKYNKSDFVVK